MSENWMSREGVRKELQKIGFHRPKEDMDAAHIIARENG